MRWLLWPSTIRAAYLLGGAGEEQLSRQAATRLAANSLRLMVTVQRYHGSTSWATGRTDKRCDSLMPESRPPDTGHGSGSRFSARCSVFQEQEEAASRRFLDRPSGRRHDCCLRISRGSGRKARGNIAVFSVRGRRSDLVGACLRQAEAEATGIDPFRPGHQAKRQPGLRFRTFVWRTHRYPGLALGRCQLRDPSHRKQPELRHRLACPM